MTKRSEPRSTLPVVLLVSGLAALASACDVPPNATETESIGPAIIDGRETTQRPEVGKLVINNSMCTATMITSRHFVTAAHCIDYAPIARGGTFTITSADGTAPQEFFVGRTLSLGWTKSGFPTSGATWMDVAVGELTRDLPRGLLRPADVDVNPIRNGDKVSIVGYGGDGHGGPAGVKRFTEFVLNGQNIVTQPGDSGGPVFRGPIWGGGGIVLVTSAFFGGPIVTDRDVFGDPVRLRSAVYAMVDALRSPGVCYRLYQKGIGYSDAQCNGAQAGFQGEDVGGIQIWSNDPGTIPCYHGRFASKNTFTSQVCDGDMLGSLSAQDRLRFVDLGVWFEVNPSGQSIFYRGYDNRAPTREARDGESWQPSVNKNFILEQLEVRQGF